MARRLKSMAQVLKVESAAKANGESVLSKAHQVFKKPALMEGFNKTYQPLQESDDGSTSLPSEGAVLQLRVPEILETVQAALSEMLDVVATKEHGNTKAAADVVVDDVVMFEKVPVTLLLSWEKQLPNLKTFIANLPVLDPSETWVWDDANNCYSTPPKLTTRVIKEPTAFEKAKATEQHPAQVEVIHVDRRVGTWTAVKRSSALDAKLVAEMTLRVNKLIDAVKVAREEANETRVEDVRVGKKFLGYIFSGAEKPTTQTPTTQTLD